MEQEEAAGGKGLGCRVRLRQRVAPLQLFSLFAAPPQIWLILKGVGEGRKRYQAGAISRHGDGTSTD